MFKIKPVKPLTYITASVFIHRYRNGIYIGIIYIYTHIHIQEWTYMVKERCPVQMGSQDIPIRNGKNILLGALQPCRLTETRNLEWQLDFFLAGPILFFLHTSPTTTLSFNLSLQLGLIISLSSNQLEVVKVTFSLVFL